MNVAGVALFDAAPLKSDDGGIDINWIKAQIRSKLQYIPRYRQRLDWVPYDRRPVGSTTFFDPRDERWQC